jgi:hypothetical protein
MILCVNGPASVGGGIRNRVTACLDPANIRSFFIYELHQQSFGINNFTKKNLHFYLKSSNPTYSIVGTHQRFNYFGLQTITCTSKTRKTGAVLNEH